MSIREKGIKMATNEERKQTAANLREAFDSCDLIHALGLNCNSFQCEDCPSSELARVLAKTLANLIEPSE